MRNCVAIPCRASSHQIAIDRSRQVEGTSEFRAAASTMREVHATRESAAPVTGERCSEGARNLRRNRCVAPKPRIRKLMLSRGSSTATRNTSAFAGRGSALNRRRRAHIGRLRGNQTLFGKMTQKVGKVGAQGLRFNVKFLDKLVISSLDGRRGSYQLPHAGAYRVQAKIFFSIQIEQHRFVIQKADQYICGNDYTVSK